MKFRTEYSIVKAPFSLSPEKPVVLAGSCFAQNIAICMNNSLWKAVTPLGTLYNPFSIAMGLDMMLDKKNGYDRFEKSLFQYNGLWNSNSFDSSFSSVNKEDCLKEFQNRQAELIDNLSEGKTLIVTFGTALCYHKSDDGVPVGNCHKRPSSLFYRERMSASDIFSYMDVVIESLHKEFPGIKIIFTVSPIRYLKDGFIGNMRSKAELILGVEHILRYNEDCCYFPAYEILNDDLRDYRFYASDLVHPSEEAIEYIWDIFKKTYVSDEGIRLLDEGSKKVKALNHRPKLGALGLPLKP